MAITTYPFEATWERLRMIEDRVRIRMERAIAAIRESAVPYAVVGGQAVGNWVARVDEALVRATRDVDIMIRRVDLDQLIPGTAKHGWIHTKTSGIDLFLDVTLCFFNVSRSSS